VPGDGKEFFFRQRNEPQLMSAEVTTPTFQGGTPKLVVELTCFIVY
jgi:hypothetical protein